MCASLQLADGDAEHFIREHPMNSRGSIPRQQSESALHCWSDASVERENLEDQTTHKGIREERDEMAHKFQGDC